MSSCAVLSARFRNTLSLMRWPPSPRRLWRFPRSEASQHSLEEMGKTPLRAAPQAQGLGIHARNASSRISKKRKNCLSSWTLQTQPCAHAGELCELADAGRTCRRVCGRHTRSARGFPQRPRRGRCGKNGNKVIEDACASAVFTHMPANRAAFPSDVAPHSQRARFPAETR